jgi:hypothetical protein
VSIGSLKLKESRTPEAREALRARCLFTISFFIGGGGCSSKSSVPRVIIEIVELA